MALRSLLGAQQSVPDILDETLRNAANQQAYADDQQFRAISQRAGGDWGKLVSMLRVKNPKMAMDIESKLAAQGKLQAETGKIGVETAKTGLEAQNEALKANAARVQQHANLLGSIKDDATKLAAIQSGVQQGLFTPDQAQQYAAMPFDSPEFQTVLQQGMAQANDQLKAAQIEGEKLQNAGRVNTNRTGAVAANVAEATQGDQISKAGADATNAQNAAQLSTATLPGQIAAAPDAVTGLTAAQQQQAQTDQQRYEAEQSRIRLQEKRDAETVRHNQALESRALQAQQQGLGLQQASHINQVASQFDGEPIVKNYNTVAEAKQFVSSLGTGKGSNAADDQGLLYAFAKAMDPNSVVREGEYNTVQKYAQSWAETFGFNAARIFSNTPFLTDAARKALKDTINKKFEAVKGQYDNVYREYGRRIETQTGAKNGTSFLTDYAKGVQAPAAAPAQAASPKIGAKQDGYVFMGGDPSDQKNWKKER